MRSAILVAIGLMMGFMSSSFALNTLRQHHAFPRGVMMVLGHHHKQLKRELAQPQCDAQRIRTQLDALAVLSADIDAAYAPIDDARFSDFADDLSTAIAHSRADDAQCPAVLERVKGIGDACNACHRVYR